MIPIVPLSEHQRNMFAQGLIELANIEAGALVFGQFISGLRVNGRVVGVGIVVALLLYLGAYAFTKR